MHWLTQIEHPVVYFTEASLVAFLRKFSDMVHTFYATYCSCQLPCQILLTITLARTRLMFFLAPFHLGHMIHQTCFLYFPDIDQSDYCIRKYIFWQHFGESRFFNTCQCHLLIFAKSTKSGEISSTGTQYHSMMPKEIDLTLTIITPLTCHLILRFAK